MPTLTSKPIVPGWGCVICGNSHPSAGPFWTTDALMPTVDRPFVLCGRCTTTQLQPLDIAPRDELLKALSGADAAKQRETDLLRQTRDLTVTVEKLEQVLQAERAQRQSLAHNHAILTQRLRDAENPGTGAMEAFRERLAEQTASCPDAPDDAETSESAEATETGEDAENPGTGAPSLVDAVRRETSRKPQPKAAA